jgi:hypothetical protein
VLTTAFVPRLPRTSTTQPKTCEQKSLVLPEEDGLQNLVGLIVATFRSGLSLTIHLHHDLETWSNLKNSTGLLFLGLLAVFTVAHPPATQHDHVHRVLGDVLGDLFPGVPHRDDELALYLRAKNLRDCVLQVLPTFVS